MKTIKLTQNKVAIVDDEDFENLTKIKWHAWYNKNTDSFYAHHSVYQKNESPSVIRMHRYILGITDADLDVDHIDGNTLNNQKYNLRPCKSHQNTTNMLKLRRDNTSGFRGVSKYFHNNLKKWVAKLSQNGKPIHIGYFDTPEEAAKAFDKKAKELYGEFCGKLNFPEENS